MPLSTATTTSRPTRCITIASGLSSPNGVAFRDGALYVAEISRVLRFDNIEARLKNPPAPVVVNDSFPDKSHHGWKFIRFGPDGKLYVPVGAPCNVCEEEDPRFASIMRMDPDGSNLEIFARGVRNTVGFDWHPRDQGTLVHRQRPRLAGGRPAAGRTQSRSAKAGLHFGFPYWHGRDIADPEVRQEAAHGRNSSRRRWNSAPMWRRSACAFIPAPCSPRATATRSSSPSTARGTAATRIGYRITLVRLKENRAVSYEIFAEGWLQKGSAWGRPVDLQVMPDGSLLVSDDKAGAIYRISYRS